MSDDFVRLVVRRRHRIDLRERVAVGAEAVLHQLLRGGDELAVERVALAGEHEAPQLRLRHHERAGELHVADLEDLAFVDVHR